MKSKKSVFVCSSCGNDYPKWHGQCPACKEWGTLNEFKESKKRPRGKSFTPDKRTTLNEILYADQKDRISTKLDEADRVLGGGVLPGSLILLGGNPGIGKSTLALQLLHGVEKKSLYVSAEESEEQIAMRARRLNIMSDHLELSGNTSIESILNHISIIKPELVVVDSIQTVYSDDVDSLPGSAGQIRECTQQLLHTCKMLGVAVIIIGHVTKEGVIAGPKMLEHMVDTVLYLEGDDRYDHRILRSVKNRFGATHEVGVFQMAGNGMVEVTNPSELFLAERTFDSAGTTVFPSLEGTRPILVEVQALVSNANFGTPQRNVNGFDYRRLSMLLAVLEKRLNIPMGTRDVFVNLVGGMKIDDPAADLAILSAVASSSWDKPVNPDIVLIGEVGLAGEVRSISHVEKRLKEASALGFKKALIPSSSTKQLTSKSIKMKINGIKTVQDALNILFNK